MITDHTETIKLTPVDNDRLATLCGHCDENLRQLEEALKVKIHNRGHDFHVTGTPNAVEKARTILLKIYQSCEHGGNFTPAKIHLFLHEAQQLSPSQKTTSRTNHDVIIKSKHGEIKPRGKNQASYVYNMLNYHINFGVGPAGTGKTYLAVACAVRALELEKVHRIILVRPVVEAGEKLGFLPGDLTQKVDPYLRPIYDALNEMLGFEKVTRLVERNIIEIAPLAFMRGRTLNDAFIILDEAQNTTREQMKMFLTRIGFGSTAVITGDHTQIDLPRGIQSGLLHAMDVLKALDDIRFTYFESKDVVRHPLVETIVRAYEKFFKDQT